MQGGGKSTAEASASSGGASAGAGAGPSASTPRACESCEAAPGIAFCRVEWSFLCASCGPALHRNSWIVAVPPSPNPITAPTSATTSSSTNQPPPFYFPPFMQMPMPMPMPPQAQAPFQMHPCMPLHIPPSNPPNPTAPATKTRRRRRSKEEMLGAAPTDTDTDRAEEVRYGQKHKTRLRPSVPPPAPPTRTDSGNADTMISNVPESTGDQAQVDAMDKFVTEMDPPPTELDEIEEAIGAEGEP